MSEDVYTEDRADSAESMLIDPDTMDPNKYYRWVHDRPQNIARKKAAGFSIVSRSAGGVKPLVELEKTADDTIRFADTILMACSKDRYNQRQSQKARVVGDRLEATAQRFHEQVEQAARSGLKVEVTESFTDRNEVDDE